MSEQRGWLPNHVWLGLGAGIALSLIFTLVFSLTNAEPAQAPGVPPKSSSSPQVPESR